ncbi:MAG: DUF1566 domain-containing protein [Proteobacteria bacterium]|nr:DUF1566 domain-containing protein [Pseudomonadota bacterium]
MERSRYWSSTEIPDQDDMVWTQYFAIAMVEINATEETAYFRCVSDK